MTSLNAVLFMTPIFGEGGASRRDMFAVAVGGYNKMHTRQTDGRPGEWAAQRLPDNLPAVRLGRRWASL